jgi:hypothetical protein
VIIIITEPIITAEATTTVETIPLVLPITRVKAGVLNLLLLKRMCVVEQPKVLLP